MATTETNAHRGEVRHGELIHVRNYRVDAYRAGANVLRLVGHIKDENPHGLVDEDPDPMPLHDMTVVLDVSVPDLAILDCRVEMSTHPHEVCPKILDRYDQVIGLSIARGFTHRVRDALGGPRGCTHVTMLVLAMAPVAWQAVFAFQDHPWPEPGSEAARAWMRAAYELNRGTCWVFADDGPMKERVETGSDWALPLWARRRAEQLGITTEELLARHNGRPAEERSG